MARSGVALPHHVLTHLLGQQALDEHSVTALLPYHPLPSHPHPHPCPIPLQGLVDEGKLLAWGGRGGGHGGGRGGHGGHHHGRGGHSQWGGQGCAGETWH